MERAVQTFGPDTTAGSGGEWDSQGHEGLGTRELVPQETFRPARQQKVPGGSQIIEFSVYGGEGIRLSDALGENWAGFGGRDDRSLFGDDRLQIMVRLHVRPSATIFTSPW